MRIIKNLNKEWFYAPNFLEDDITQDKIDTNRFVQVNLPHTNIEVPYNYFDDKCFQFISCYKKEIYISDEYEGKKTYIDFEGIMAYAQIYVNGKFVGEHKGGYTPFSVDITKAIIFNKINVVTVVVDSRERDDIPPFGGVIDYLTFGGIYREAYLRFVEKSHIDNVFAKAHNVLQDSMDLEIDVSLITDNGYNLKELSLMCILRDKNKVIGQETNVVNNKVTSIKLEELKNIILWDIDNPYLYEIEVKLFESETEIDCVRTHFGFREAKFKADGFYLNGKKIKLIGLNRHQSYPYVGYAMPKRVQQKDADILKKELGVNIVRTSHYPQSRHFLDRCDEIGLLVFEEIPGWQYIGGEMWQQQVLNDVESMIKRDRNRPSIVIWGIRINESKDCSELYRKTNKLARELDPTRQTGGVRYSTGSELLEDVYTMNDFIHDGGYRQYLSENIKDFKTYDDTVDIDGKEVALRSQRQVTGLDYYVPYLVTEHTGHMYPTKKFDQEERVMEHALRHARVQNAAYLDDTIAGAIGWCAFDYYTHSDFGSGDKICYHGVMDMFRIPKFASYAYRSQKHPSKEVVLEPVTYWSRGERSIGGVIPLVIFTNCDYVKFYYGDEYKGQYYPNTEKFSGLPYPPVIVDELTGYWGMEWEDARFEGYIDNKKVICRKLARNPIPTELKVLADDKNLLSGEIDATRVVVQALDQYGNIMPFFFEPIKVIVEGEGELIGPSFLPLIGGSIAFWIKTNGNKGNININILSERFKEKNIVIDVI